MADIRYAWRMLVYNRGFTAIAVSALALGIGANTAIFTVVNAVLLQPLAYPHPDRTMRLGRKYPNGTGDSNSIPKYMVWRQNHVFESMALYDGTGHGASLGGDERAEPVATAHVSWEYFKVFGVPLSKAGLSLRQRICQTALSWPSSVTTPGSLVWEVTGRPSDGSSS